jgi:hypothetical protein
MPVGGLPAEPGHVLQLAERGLRILPWQVIGQAPSWRNKPPWIGTFVVPVADEDVLGIRSTQRCVSLTLASHSPRPVVLPSRRRSPQIQSGGPSRANDPESGHLVSEERGLVPPPQRGHWIRRGEHLVHPARKASASKTSQISSTSGNHCGRWMQGAVGGQ